MRCKIILVLPMLLLCVAGSAQNTTRLSLQHCIELAEKNNAALLNADLDVSYARAKKAEAFTYYFPTVNVSSMAIRFQNPLLEIQVSDILGKSDMAQNLNWYINTAANLYGINTSYSLLQSGYSANVSLMQPVYAGGKIVNSNRLAKLGIKAAELQKSLTSKSTNVEIQDKFWQVISLEKKMDVVDSGLSLLDSLYKDVNSAYKAGLAVETDLNEVGNERNELRIKHSRLRSGIRLAKMDLLNTIGMKYCILESSATNDIPALDNIIFDDDELYGLEPSYYYYESEMAADSMEEAELLNLSVKSHELQKKIVLAEALPQIGIGASYGYGQVVGNPKWDGAILASIKIPISDWGKTSHKLRQEEALRQKAINDRDFLRKQLMLQVQMLWEEVLLSWEEVLAANESVGLKRTIALQTESDYNAGVATFTQFMKAQLDLNTAETGLIDRRLDYHNAVNKYLRKRGNSSYVGEDRK